MISALLGLALLSGDPWTAKDTALETVFAASLTADMSQTIDIGEHCPHLYEDNPLIGRCPQRGRVEAYGVASLALHASIAYALPRRYRTAWQIVWIGVEGYNIGSNAYMGLKFQW